MSENLDLVRSIYADWENGEFGELDWAAPTIELVAGDGLEPGSISRGTGVTAGWREWLSSWRDYKVQADEFREIDGGRVHVLALQSGRGKASGLLVSKPGANVFHVREGKVTKLFLYNDRDRAFADLGLAE